MYEYLSEATLPVEKLVGNSCVCKLYVRNNLLKGLISKLHRDLHATENWENFESKS